MKKRNLFFLLSLLVFSFTFVGCKKNKKSVDYREQYVGQYEFTQYYSFTVLVAGLPTTYDTIGYMGSVSLVNDSSVLVTFPQGDPKEFFVSTSGVLTKCGKDVGSMSATGLFIEYDDDFCTVGPLGANTLTKLIGVKQ